MADTQPESNWQFQPGETVHPGDATQTAEPSLPAPIEQSPAEPAPAAPAEPAADPEVSVTATTPIDPNTVTINQGEPQITWTASEYIDHAKSADWYLALAVAAVLGAGAVYLLFRDVITSTVIVVAALAFGLYGRRRPRQLQYSLTMQGLGIGDKFFPYSTFRSFALMDEGHFSSIAFLPLKRFGFLTTVYYDPQDEDAIINIISQHLPLEPRSADPVDRFMKRIRF
jgi:hypothetical protein